MKVPKKSDIPHKLALYRLLEALLANPFVANSIYFKGGTCAAMLGYLDRFSVDLDFDLKDKSKKNDIRKEIHAIIHNLGYIIKDESVKHLQFFLKYRDIEKQRNTLKLEISDLVSSENKYKEYHLIEIDRYCRAQTIETMFANKLVALKARWEEGKGVAGRDMYDIHHFFLQGYSINEGVIEDIRGVNIKKYSEELINFIEGNISEKGLIQDLNPLIQKEKMHAIVPRIKKEVILALKELV